MFVLAGLACTNLPVRPWARTSRWNLRSRQGRSMPRDTLSGPGGASHRQAQILQRFLEIHTRRAAGDEYRHTSLSWTSSCRMKKEKGRIKVLPVRRTRRYKWTRLSKPLKGWAWTTRPCGNTPPRHGHPPSTPSGGRWWPSSCLSSVDPLAGRPVAVDSGAGCCPRHPAACCAPLRVLSVPHALAQISTLSFLHARQPKRKDRLAGFLASATSGGMGEASCRRYFIVSATAAILRKLPVTQKRGHTRGPSECIGRSET